MNIAKFFLVIFLLASNKFVFAEGNCPPGYFPSHLPDFVGCAPVYNPNSSLTPQTPPNSGPIWEPRWGAIAIDDAKGIFGAVDGSLTKRKAKRGAINLCRSNGGTNCNVVTDYSNECGTLAWGANKYVTYTGSIPDEIKIRSIESCSKLTSNCQIYYAGCSFPIKIR